MCNMYIYEPWGGGGGGGMPIYSDQIFDLMGMGIDGHLLKNS